MRVQRLGCVILVAYLASCKGMDTPAAPTAPIPPPRLSSPPMAPPAPPLPTSATDADLVFCVTETNRYRATVGAAPVSRSSVVEAHAAAAAASDSRTQNPHGYSRMTPIAGAWAENEVLRWSLASYGTVQATMRAAIAAFWSEGAGGGHYENMRGRYSVVGCGVAIDGQTITMVQHFRER